MFWITQSSLHNIVPFVTVVLASFDDDDPATASFDKVNVLCLLPTAFINQR
jgi:hypothetical protein